MRLRNSVLGNLYRRRTAIACLCTLYCFFFGSPDISCLLAFHQSTYTLQNPQASRHLSTLQTTHRLRSRSSSSSLSPRRTSHSRRRPSPFVLRSVTSTSSRPASPAARKNDSSVYRPVCILATKCARASGVRASTAHVVRSRAAWSSEFHSVSAARTTSAVGSSADGSVPQACGTTLQFALASLRATFSRSVWISRGSGKSLAMTCACG
jgi:hypothetical protein